MDNSGDEVVTVVLGAGASRSVSYVREMEIPSPLDGDFFDLLQRVKPGTKDEAAVEFIRSAWTSTPQTELRQSMERFFYTLHQRAFLRRTLIRKYKDSVEEERIVSNFARVVQFLLRTAHWKEKCDKHQRFLQRLGAGDCVITFNYDLVVERALRGIAEKRAPFGEWVYGLEHSDEWTSDFPIVLKLHGSSNWKLVGDGEERRFYVKTKKWADFDTVPGYLRTHGVGTHFPIFLPFWDKRIEEPPWNALWKKAVRRLRNTQILVVCGYSLPPTDVKSKELFTISFPRGGDGVKLCVIDPSPDSRRRWRGVLMNAQYWEYGDLQEFLDHPPRWWRNRAVLPVTPSKRPRQRSSRD